MPSRRTAVTVVAAVLVLGTGAAVAARATHSTQPKASAVVHTVSSSACTTKPFPDVPVGSPFCVAITWLKTTGATAGFRDGTFRPTADISRQAVATFLY